MPRVLGPNLPYVPNLDQYAESLPAYINFSHRCAPLVYGEETIDGFMDSVKSGFLPEFDLQQLVDGTLVACHDDTVDRTMTNIGTGNVNTKTQAQWRAARVKPAVEGGVTHDALFWNEMLDQFGRRAIIVPELKDGDAATATAFIAGIKKRGMERNIIAQCFGYATAKMFAQNGIPSMFLSSNMPVGGAAGVPVGWTWASMKADGITFFCFNFMRSDTNILLADVNAAKAAGLKVVGYTANTLADQAKANTLGLHGVFTNDPWLTSGNVQTQSGLNVAAGIRPKGSTYYRYSVASTTTVAGTTALPPKDIGINGESFGIPNALNTMVTYFHLPNFGVITIPCRISMRIQFGQPAGGLTTNAGFVLSNVPVAGFFEDNAHTLPAAQNAIACVVRRNGQLASWKYVAGADAVAVNNTPATVAGVGTAPNWTTMPVPTPGVNEVGPTTGEGYVDFTALITTTTIQLFAQSPAYLSTTGTMAGMPFAQLINATDTAVGTNPAWSLNSAEYNTTQRIAMTGGANSFFSTPAVAHGMTAPQLAGMELTLRFASSGASYISDVRYSPTA